MASSSSSSSAAEQRRRLAAAKQELAAAEQRLATAKQELDVAKQELAKLDGAHDVLRRDHFRRWGGSARYVLGFPSHGSIESYSATALAAMVQQLESSIKCPQLKLQQELKNCFFTKIASINHFSGWCCLRQVRRLPISFSSLFFLSVRKYLLILFCSSFN